MNINRSLYTSKGKGLKVKVVWLLSFLSFLTERVISVAVTSLAGVRVGAIGFVAMSELVQIIADGGMVL